MIFLELQLGKGTGFSEECNPRDLRGTEVGDPPDLGAHRGVGVSNNNWGDCAATGTRWLLYFLGAFFAQVCERSELKKVDPHARCDHG